MIWKFFKSTIFFSNDFKILSLPPPLPSFLPLSLPFSLSGFQTIYLINNLIYDLYWNSRGITIIYEMTNMILDSRSTYIIRQVFDCLHFSKYLPRVLVHLEFWNSLL